MKAKIEDGKITGFFIGFNGEKDLIDVPEKVAANPDNFNYADGKFVERKLPEQPKMKSLEQRVAELENKVAILTEQKTVDTLAIESL